MAPDLILIVQEGGERQTYERLSRIAPTVALPVGAQPHGASWQDVTRLIARSLGLEANGEKLAAETDDYLHGIAAEHPEFTGRTVSYLDVFGSDVYFGGPDSAAVTMMRELGYVSPSYIADFPDARTQNLVSLELLPAIDADVVLVYTFGRTTEQLVDEVPAFGRLDSVREGRFHVLPDVAVSQPSVLSIPHAIDALLPFLATSAAR